MRLLIPPLTVVVLLVFTAASAAQEDSGDRPAASHPPAHPSLAPLAFLAGTWFMEQPRGAMIEEHWSAPRGNGMLGSFRRVLGNGAIPFYEFTQLVVEGDEVILRQIHVHGNFDTDPRRKDPMVLRLETVEGTMVSFVPLADAKLSSAGSLERVSYTLDEAGVLTVRVQEKPRGAKEGEAPPEPQVIVLPMKRALEPKS